MERVKKFSYLETRLLLEQKLLWWRYWKISFYSHITILLAFLLWTLFFPNQPMLIQPAIQVDIVDLPNFTKNKAPVADTSLPVKDAVQPKPEVEIPEPTPDLMTLKKDEKKLQKEEAQKALERLKEKLAKKNKAERKKLMEEKKKELEKFEEKFRPRLAGQQLSQGNSASGAAGVVVNAYIGHVQDKIRAHWELPPYLQSSGLRASVRLYIDARGNPRYFLSTKSGNDIFDSLVKDAIERSKPFAPPPRELSQELKENGLEVLFPL